MARCFVEATAARGGIQIPGSSCVPMAWPRSDRALWLLLGRGQVALCGFCLAEVRSCFVASAWPRSGRALWLLRGRGQVVLCGFCVAEVKSCSGASAWPRSSRALWGLLGRGQVFVRGFSSFSCAVHGVSGSRGPTSSRPGVLLVFVLSGVCFSSVLRCSFLFSVVHCGSGILVGWALGSSHCAAVSPATDSIDMFLGDGVCSSSLVMPFLARLLCSVFGCPFRVVLRLNSFFSFRSVSRLACLLI